MTRYTENGLEAAIIIFEDNEIVKYNRFNLNPKTGKYEGYFIELEKNKEKFYEYFCKGGNNEPV